ncbi:response regulator [Halioxenophilus aromaticivorans]|uniref:Response regulator n=1 Tax=Halioxenophilus aromaticivorans TaxID=1306992 RepID=A0AAV3TWY1_9ALTE
MAATNVIICDDSGMARKQLARSLPPDWPVVITYAGNGQEAIAALQQGLGEVIFLDLTMPVMDGYETLEEIRRLNLKASVFVVSGDVQEEARRRVLSLGAIDFIEKPASADTIAKTLSQQGAYKSEVSLAEARETAGIERIEATNDQGEISFIDCYREITNVAIGHAGDLLARLTGEFIQLPIPKVAMLEPSELLMALAFANDESVSAVCQGFIGKGIAGEALLLFSDTSFAGMAELLRLNREDRSAQQAEVLADLSGILLGAILNGLGKQLDLNFSQGYPTVLGHHTNISSIISANTNKWEETLTIEVNYSIENYDLVCDVLLLFTHDSIASINSRLAFFYDLDEF